MKPIKMPRGVAHAAGPQAKVIVVGPAEPTDGAEPCEYLVMPSHFYPGKATFTALVELDDDDRAAIAAGAHIALQLEVTETPWSLQTVHLTEPINGQRRR